MNPFRPLSEAVRERRTIGSLPDPARSMKKNLMQFDPFLSGRGGPEPVKPGEHGAPGPVAGLLAGLVGDAGVGGGHAAADSTARGSRAGAGPGRAGDWGSAGTAA